MGMSSPGEFDSIADMGMVRKLLRDPLYDIPERLRDKVLKGAETLVDRFTNGDETAAAFIAASRLVLEADKRNLDLIKMVIPKRVEHKEVIQFTTQELEQIVREAHKRLPPAVVLDVECNPL